MNPQPYLESRGDYVANGIHSDVYLGSEPLAKRAHNSSNCSRTTKYALPHLEGEMRAWPCAAVPSCLL